MILTEFSKEASDIMDGKYPCMGRQGVGAYNITQEQKDCAMEERRANFTQINQGEPELFDKYGRSGVGRFNIT